MALGMAGSREPHVWKKFYKSLGYIIVSIYIFNISIFYLFSANKIATILELLGYIPAPLKSYIFNHTYCTQI